MISVLSVALAFIALGTSTFAWFSMNTEVTASGMSLTAATPVNLLIAPTSGGTFKNSATANETYLKKLLPASSNLGTPATMNAIQANQSVDNTVENDGLGGVVDFNGDPSNTGLLFQASGVPIVDYESKDGYYVTYDYYLKLSEDVANTYAYLASLKVVSTYVVPTATTASAGKLAAGALSS